MSVALHYICDMARLMEEIMAVEAGCATSGASPVTIVVAIERLRQAAEGVDLRKSLQM